MAVRKLIVAEEFGIYRVTTPGGHSATANTVENALLRVAALAAPKSSLEPGSETHFAGQLLETLMGPKNDGNSGLVHTENQ